MVDYLNQGKKKTLDSFKKTATLELFEKTFTNELNKYFLYQVGLKKSFVEKKLQAARKEHSQSTSQLYFF